MDHTPDGTGKVGDSFSFNSSLMMAFPEVVYFSCQVYLVLAHTLFFSHSPSSNNFKQSELTDLYGRKRFASAAAASARPRSTESFRRPSTTGSQRARKINPSIPSPRFLSARVARPVHLGCPRRPLLRRRVRFKTFRGRRRQAEGVELEDLCSLEPLDTHTICF